MAKKLKHDGLFKKIMINQIAAQNFLEYYLPADFKAMLDFSTIKVEKESYVEELTTRRNVQLISIMI